MKSYSALATLEGLKMNEIDNLMRHGFLSVDINCRPTRDRLHAHDGVDFFSSVICCSNFLAAFSETFRVKSQCNLSKAQ